MFFKKGAERGDGATWTLAGRLTLWYTATTFALILAVSGYLYWNLKSKLEKEDDEFLADYVSILRTLLEEHPDDLSAFKQEVEWESEARRHSKVFVRILDGGMKLVAETPGMTEILPARSFPDPVALAAEPSHGTSLLTDGGDRFLMMAALSHFGKSPDQLRLIQVALDQKNEEKLLADVAKRSLPVLSLSLILCAAVGYQIARRGIRPVTDISETARHIRSSTLAERIKTKGLPLELAVLGATFNEMLGRLQDSFDRLARFSADIAHELRTPLNNLRGEIEVALGKPRTAEEYREVLSSCLEEGLRLSRMIDNLLFLARAEDPQTMIRREGCNIGVELETIRDFYESAAAEAGISLEIHTTEQLSADLDRTLFQRAIGNLIENALVHTPRGGKISLHALKEKGGIRLKIQDTGCGIPREHLTRIFDRFYRVDQSRSNATGGMGLGLAIVKSIAELHGGNAAITSEVGKGTCVQLLFHAGKK